MQRSRTGTARSRVSGSFTTTAALRPASRPAPANSTSSVSGQHDFQGALGNLSSTRKFGRWTNATVNASRDLDFSIFLNNNFYVADRVSASLAWEATRHLQLIAQDAIGRDLYATPVSGPHGFLRRRDVFTFPSVGFTYTFSRLRAGADIGYVRRTSNFDANLDHGIRILFRLSLTP